MKCKNCGEEVAAKFCSFCGQDSKVDTLTFSRLWTDLYESVFQINKGFLYTLTELFVRPGDSIREYIDGKRKNHFKPIAYLLILSTIYFLVSKFTAQETWINSAITGFHNGATDTQSGLTLPPIVEWFARNYAYTTLLLIPIFSLASFIGFKKYKANFLEHIVLNSYITGQQAILYTAFALANRLINQKVLESLPLLLGITYCVYVYKQFFKINSVVATIARSVITYSFYLVLGTLLLGVVISIQFLLG